MRKWSSLIGCGLIIFALLSVIGAAGTIKLSYDLRQGGNRNLALVIRNTSDQYLNRFDIRYRVEGFKVDSSCIAVGGGQVKRIENQPNHWGLCGYWPCSKVWLKDEGLAPGGTLICEVSKEGATAEEYIDYIKNPRTLIHSIYGVVDILVDP